MEQAFRNVDLWVVVDDDGYTEPDVFVFDTEVEARAFARAYIAAGHAEDVWVTGAKSARNALEAGGAR